MSGQTRISRIVVVPLLLLAAVAVGFFFVGIEKGVVTVPKPMSDLARRQMQQELDIQ